MWIISVSNSNSTNLVVNFSKCLWFRDDQWHLLSCAFDLILKWFPPCLEIPILQWRALPSAGRCQWPLGNCRLWHRDGLWCHWWMACLCGFMLCLRGYQPQNRIISTLTLPNNTENKRRQKDCRGVCAFSEVFWLLFDIVLLDPWVPRTSRRRSARPLENRSNCWGRSCAPFFRGSKD